MPAQPARQPSATASAAPNARPAPSKLRLRIAYLSDVGRARDHQEDAVGVFTPSDPALLARKGQLMIVADGMGGHNAGEVASQTAVAEIQRAYFGAATDDIPASLHQALLTANQAIRQLAQGDASRRGMGTTAAVVVARELDVHIANVGDSRVYLLRNGTIAQITQDHSWVEEQVRAGVLTPEQARSHPQRNVITRALGSGATVEPDLFQGALQEGDVLLLCSDGLSNLVSDAELLAIAGQAAPQQAVRQLVDLANERGGVDNISVIVARAETPESAAAAAPPAAARRFPVVLLAAALVLVAAGAVAVLLTRGGGEESVTPTAVAATPSAVGEVAIATTAATDTPLGANEAVQLTAAATDTIVADLSPTATLKPTEAPTATPTAPAIQSPPATRPTVRATATTPAPVAGSLPAPQLLQPVNGFTALEGLQQEFSWQWTGGANPAYRFQIFMRKLGAEAWQPVLNAIALGADGVGRLTVVVSEVPVVRTGGASDYEWTVAVVRSDGGQLSEYAAPWRFVYRSSGVSQPTLVMPTTPPATPSRTLVPQPTTPAPPPTTTEPPSTTPEPSPTTTEPPPT